MTVQEFLDVDSSYYDKFYLCIDDEYDSIMLELANKFAE